MSFIKGKKFAFHGYFTIRKHHASRTLLIELLNRYGGDGVYQVTSDCDYIVIGLKNIMTKNNYNRDDAEKFDIPEISLATFIKKLTRPQRQWLYLNTQKKSHLGSERILHLRKSTKEKKAA